MFSWCDEDLQKIVDCQLDLKENGRKYPVVKSWKLKYFGHYVHLQKINFTHVLLIHWTDSS